MKVRNKATGEINEIKIGAYIINVYTEDGDFIRSVTIRELNEGWKEYIDSKVYWYIDDAGVIQIDQVLSSEINMRKSIGNYFETKEEAERAVKKLKAWKRLKDNGVKIHLQKQFRSDGIGYSRTIYTDFTKDSQEIVKDLDLLFGGEDVSK